MKSNSNVKSKQKKSALAHHVTPLQLFCGPFFQILDARQSTVIVAFI